MEIQFEWILLLARLVLGSGMIYYGWPKARDLRANAKDFEQMGFKPGIFWGTLIAAVEFLGGIAVVLGVYAELAASLFAFQMLVGAFWKIRLKKAFTDYSYDFQLFALALVIMSQGAGTLAPAHFPGTIFLNWYVAAAALAGALVMACGCKPSGTKEAPPIG
ncbi:MAG TPA: DoxX family protein [Candidatus Binatia bacterium]|jgi:putative oxidoreductase